MPTLRVELQLPPHTRGKRAEERPKREKKHASLQKKRRKGLLIPKYIVPLHPQMGNTPQGTMAEWLGTGLQNRLQQFESAWYLTNKKVSQIERLFSFLPAAKCITLTPNHNQKICLQSVAGFRRQSAVSSDIGKYQQYHQ